MRCFFICDKCYGQFKDLAMTFHPRHHVLHFGHWRRWWCRIVFEEIDTRGLWYESSASSASESAA